MRWSGFAGLAQTVVERLLREGGEEPCDVRASSHAHAEVLATARHVTGGECTAVRLDDSGWLSNIHDMQRRVRAAGGAASPLMQQICEAGAYLRSCQGAERRAQPEAHWRAYQDIVAGCMLKPDWRITSSSASARDEAAAQEELAGALARGAIYLGKRDAAMRRAWEETAAREVTWRARQEVGRGLLRVCMRAWREVTDGVPARAAAWQQRWEQGGPDTCKLARRLTFGSDGDDGDDLERAERQVRARVMANRVARGDHVPEEDQAACTRAQRWQTGHWGMSFVLAWMRLVRAGAVREKRERSPAWQLAQPSA